MDYAKEAKRHREMAEEYRAMADRTSHPELRPHYRALGETYEMLAENEVRVANNIKLAH